MNDIEYYGYKALTVIPPWMKPWNNYIEHPIASSPKGRYVLVGAQAADIEQHHQVTVLDENGKPLRGIWIIFAYPGGNGPRINFDLTQDLWPGRPMVLTGNRQRTNGYGYCQHTVGEGGESIFVFDVNGAGELNYPSPIVHNNIWIGNAVPNALFIHTGVHLTFQRRDADIVPQANIIADLQRRVEQLEDYQELRKAD